MIQQAVIVVHMYCYCGPAGNVSVIQQAVIVVQNGLLQRSRMLMVPNALIQKSMLNATVVQMQCYSGPDSLLEWSSRQC